MTIRTKAISTLLGIATLAGAQAGLAQTPSTRVEANQDRSQMVQEVNGMKGDSAHIRADNAKLRTLKTRMLHEHGARRAATQAEIDKVMADSQVYRNQNKALGTANHTNLADYRHDLTTGRPH